MAWGCVSEVRLSGDPDGDLAGGDGVEPHPAARDLNRAVPVFDANIAYRGEVRDRVQDLLHVASPLVDLPAGPAPPLGGTAEDQNVEHRVRDPDHLEAHAVATGEPGAAQAVDVRVGHGRGARTVLDHVPDDQRNRLRLAGQGERRDLVVGRGCPATWDDGDYTMGFLCCATWHGSASSSAFCASTPSDDKTALRAICRINIYQKKDKKSTCDGLFLQLFR